MFRSARSAEITATLLFALLIGLSTGCAEDPDQVNQNQQQNDNDSDDNDIDGIETHLRCHEGPPEDADPAPEPPEYSGDQCPSIEIGRNTMESSGTEREFVVVAPDGYDFDEPIPVIFMWHWLAGTADSFIERGELQKATDTLDFLAIVPESVDGDPLQWPYSTSDAHDEERYQEELTFFDDMLSCADTSFDINNQCVSTAGISAGGLWTSQLASQRSDYLSSFIALAGGVGEPNDGNAIVRPWEPAERKLPGIVLWGGPTDICLTLDFQQTSQTMERQLENQGHFFLECIHDCGHTQPPSDPAEGEAIMSGFWQFTLDHPRWVQEGTSPYTHGGLPNSMPDWCDIGRDSAQIRDGECEPDECS